MITHAELVARACTWLRQKQRCTVVLAESGSNRQETRGRDANGASRRFSEIPDAIGWTANRYESRLIECKATYSDFAADARKIARLQRHLGVGMRRWYLVSDALFEQIVDAHGGWLMAWSQHRLESWGLLVAKRRGRFLQVQEHFDATQQDEWNGAAEQALLVAELRRLTVFGGQPAGRKVGVQNAIVRPVELPLACPACGAWHVDDGSCTPNRNGLANQRKAHRTHVCRARVMVDPSTTTSILYQYRECGHRWTPTHLFPTVGVLPKGATANG